MANVIIKRTCRDCGKDFEISAGEKKFYESNQLELPKRCPACREKRKNAKSGGAK